MITNTLRLWQRALFSPSIETFQREIPSARLDLAIAWVVVAGLLTGGTGAFFQLLRGLFAGQALWRLILTWLTGMVVVPVVVLTTFLILSAVFYLIARVLRGQGSFISQTYLLAAIYAPLTLISGVLASISCLGPVVGLAAALYSAFLVTQALRAVHRYNLLEAVVTWMGPALFLLFLSCSCGMLSLAPLLGKFLGSFRRMLLY